MMPRSVFVLLLSFLVGCVQPAIIPSKDYIADVRHIHVVAMEAPPIIIPSRYQSAAGNSSGIGPLIPIQAGGGSIGAVRGIGIFNTILILAQLSEASHRTYGTSNSSQTVLDTKGAWTPTVILASEVSRQLRTSGIAADVVSGVRPIPGMEYRGMTTTMENWLAPIRAYYNDSGPIYSYHDIASDPSHFVLELIISNYEVGSDGKLNLQVGLKLIDPRSGRVVGRARSYNAWNRPNLEPLDKSFSNDASIFKEVFSKAGSELVKDSLVQLGLLLPAN